jgi:4-hydroxybenzoate polyprenyltransferase
MWEALRPRQWAKNMVLFAGLMFSKSIFDPVSLGKVVAAFFVFCVAASGVYLLNDYLDREQDRHHPRKKLRPVASGRIHPPVALSMAVFLMACSLAAGLLVDSGLFLMTAVYLAIETLYSIVLKRVVILDVFCIASGFLLRVLAGVVVIDVPISNWLLVCTIFLSLFLALGKRRAEILLLQEHATHHRSVLSEYSLSFIDQMITIVTASTVLSYVLYTLSAETISKFHTKNLLVTSAFVIYGVFRYLYLIYQKNEGDAPDRLLFSDRPLLINLGLYAAAVFIILYR